MNQIILKAKHFKDSDFIKPENCPIWKALNENEPNIRFGVGPHSFTRNYCEDDRTEVYFKEIYGSTECDEDSIKAKACDFDDTVIRIIEIAD